MVAANVSSGVMISMAMTRGATSAFVGFVATRQLAAKIPVKDRIQLHVVKGSGEPTLVKPRSKALPILVLLAGLVATAAVAFTRDNVARRRGAPVLTPTMPRSETAEPATHGRWALGTVSRADSGARQHGVPDERSASS